MKKSILTTLLLIAITTTALYGQNRLKFNYILSQKKISDNGFVLVNWNPTSNSGRGGYTDTMVIGNNEKLSSIIKLDSKGNILVDFWQISHGPVIKGKWFWRRTVTTEDTFRRLNSDTVNSLTFFNIDNPPKLSDRRDSVGKATRVLDIPFKGVTFGVVTIPFRYRGPQVISASEKINYTVTSPKPDISFTGGWTFGKSIITNRSIINYSVTFGAFVGLTGAEIKDGVVHTGSFLYGTGRTTKQVQNNPAMSYGAALTFARNNLGLVFSYGFDYSLGSFSEDWVYQNKPWFGIGLSANLGIF